MSIITIEDININKYDPFKVFMCFLMADQRERSFWVMNLEQGNLTDRWDSSFNQSEYGLYKYFYVEHHKLLDCSEIIKANSFDDPVCFIAI